MFSGPNDQWSDEPERSEGSFAPTICWASRQYSRVSDFAVGNRTNVCRRNGDDRSRPPGEGNKLDLEGLVVWVNMNYGADIAHLKAFGNDGFGQNHSVMFANHAATIL